MNKDLQVWIEKVKKIEMNNYHEMILEYGKEVVDSTIFQVIKESTDNGLENDEDFLNIWEKYGYFFATCDKNFFFDDFVKKFTRRDKEKKVQGDDYSKKDLFSSLEEVYYGFHLLKRDYIEIFDDQEDYISLDLNKIFNSICCLDDAIYLLNCFDQFYRECERTSNFDQYFKKILSQYKKGVLNQKLLSCSELGISSKKDCVLLSSAELREQIDMYISYSKAFYLFEVHNFKLVWSFVEKNFGHWNFEDLVQSGIFGLIEAFKRFDIRRGIHFSRYAYFWIQKYVFNCVYLDFNSFSLSKSEVSLQNKAMKIFDDYFSLTGKEISREELAEKLGRKDLNKLPFFRNRSNIICSSLDVLEIFGNSACFKNFSSADYNKNLALLDVIADERVNVERDSIFQYDFQLLLKYIDEILSSREKDVLFKRAGYQVDQKMTLQDIALEYGVAKETVRLIEKRAIQKLIRTKKGRELNPYC